MEHIISNTLNDYRLVFKDNYVAYQQTKMQGLFRKELVVLREFRISYRNIDYIEYEKYGRSPNVYTSVDVTIQLINPQPEFTTMTLKMGFSGVWCNRELDVIFEEVNQKIGK